MENLENQFIQELQLRNYSSKTIRSYVSCLRTVSGYYKQSPAKINSKQLRDYLHYCITGKNASQSQINQVISAFKILYVNILKMDWSIQDIPRPKREKRLPVVLSKSEVKALFDVTINPKHKIVLMLTYSAGLRLGEVSRIKITDIDSKRMQIKVNQGKGRKDRYTLLSPKILPLLRDYWHMYRPKNWLFVGCDKNRHISTRTIQNIFKKGLKKAGIHKTTGIHSLRHSFATHLLEQGVNIYIIQKLLGHSSPKTTCVYLHVCQHTVSKVINPIDELLNE
jgi:integrase/recombinase XerD